MLCPDNITHIKYSAGGFFKRHTDHCRGASNLIEEFTLVVNVNPDNVPCEGGSTVIHLPSGSASTFATTFDQTTQLGGGLLFRKDLEHEGLPVRPACCSRRRRAAPLHAHSDVDRSRPARSTSSA